MALLRVTGEVTKFERKTGRKVNKETGETRDWCLDKFKVLVAKQDVVDVQRFSDGEDAAALVGELVDWLVTCEARMYQGSAQQSVDYDSDWPS